MFSVISEEADTNDILFTKGYNTSSTLREGGSVTFVCLRNFVR